MVTSMIDTFPPLCHNTETGLRSLEVCFTFCSKYTTSTHSTMMNFHSTKIEKIKVEELHTVKLVTTPVFHESTGGKQELIALLDIASLLTGLAHLPGGAPASVYN